MAQNFFQKRLLRERKQIARRTIDGVRLADEDHDRWVVEIESPQESLYRGKCFKLLFEFGPNYPIEPPHVRFIGTPPVHPHIYSNGSICLSILHDNWSPALGVEAISLSIISMLASTTKLIPPPDDDVSEYIHPKQMRFTFHDETV